MIILQIVLVTLYCLILVEENYWENAVETYSSQLLGGDGAVSILVEEGECLLELSDLLLSQLISLEHTQLDPRFD